MTWKEQWMLWAVPPVASTALRWIGWTLHIEEDGRRDLYPQNKKQRGVIYVAWHSRLLLGMYAYRGHGICVLVSQSRDGEILARALDRFGFQTTRGSSSRGGLSSLKQLARTLKSGQDVMVAPDGPRGPREQAQLGAVQLACLTGAPIIPWTWAGNRILRLGSWDRLRVPLPFGRCKFWIGRPLEVPRESSRGDLERIRRELEAELRVLAALEKEAFPGLADEDEQTAS
ncbi:MAG: lysophospholipid acyltransferase family protein [Planctomycetes bacterium]|nr:lysophospholipid acyltransferase family protein [Planctomycetota bacterium]